MKWLLPGSMILFVALGCGNFGGGRPAGNTNVSPSPTPKVKVKVADFPSLFGKPVAEIKKQVKGEIDYESEDTIKYEIKQGYLDFDTRDSVKNRITFRLQDNASGQYLDVYAKDPQELADFVGIDLTGKSPNASSSDSFVRYDDVFGGKPVEIAFSKEKTSDGKDKFNYLTVQTKDK